MDENTNPIKSGLSKKTTATISGAVAIITYIVCESGILQLFTGA